MTIRLLLDGLRNTREWLKRNRKEPATDSPASANGAVDIKVISSVLVDSFMELLNWDENCAWPEVRFDAGSFLIQMEQA